MTSRAILITTILLTFILLGACGPSIEEQYATETQISDPAGLLQAALTAQLRSTHHLRSEVNMNLSFEGKNLDMPYLIESDIQPPDRMHTVFSAIVSGENVKFETIQIGDEVYMTDPLTGEWQYEEDQETVLFSSFGRLTMIDASDLENLVFVGMETLEGETVYHLRGEAKMNVFVEDADGETIVEFWIDPERMLRKSTIEGNFSSPADAFGIPGTGDVAIDWKQTDLWSEFGKELAIEAP